MPLRGYFSGVTVELVDGLRYPVSFYDPVRLRETLETDVRWGNPFFTEPGLVVVPEVTPAVIRDVIGWSRSGCQGFGVRKYRTADPPRSAATAPSSSRSLSAFSATDRATLTAVNTTAH
jgi:hypothetical protein